MLPKSHSFLSLTPKSHSFLICSLILILPSVSELVVADSADLRGRIDLMEDGYNIFPAHKQGIGGIVSRIRAIMDYLIIIEDSPDVERELINYVWIDKRGEIPIDKFNHALDAIAYYFTHIRLQGNT